MQITKLGLKRIKESNKTKALLCAEFDKNMQTIDNWIKVNSVMLTTIQALKIIRKETGLADSELLTNK